MRRYLSWGILAIAIAVSCGGRVLDSGSGGSAGTGNGAGGTTGTGTTTGTGGSTVGGTTTGTGGSTVGGTTTGTGGATTGTTGTTGTTTGTGGATTGTGGTGTKGGAGGTGGSGGTGGTIDPGPEYSSCTGPGQCELAIAKCCACGVLGLNDGLAAINSAKRDAFSKTVCANMPNPCPPCGPGIIEPHLLARCESGRCRGFDIRSDPTYTKCGSDQECFLRKGLSCCECQAAGDWVALSRVGGMLISGEVCAATSVCPGCVPIPPVELVAVCRNGACTEMKIPAMTGSGLP